ncbi:MAG: type II secretion system F family protein, partial [Pseudomonadota bacterium]
MNHYSYKAVDANGNVLKGILEGQDAISVQSSLTTRGLYVLQVRESGKLLKKFEERLSAFRISRKDVIEFSSNMAIMLRAGVPLLSALEDIIKTMTNEFMKGAIIDVKKNTEMGVKFYYALNLQTKIFPVILILLSR